MDGESVAYVSFVISGTNIDPDEISRLLDLIPDRSHRRGEYPKGDRPSRERAIVAPYDSGMWLLSSKAPRTDSFQAHLENLVSVLKPKGQVIRGLVTEAEVFFGCDVWNLDGIDIPGYLIQDIAALGASIAVTIYSD